ncbi:ferric reductase-like transmembrane domain-containing protein [Candidatus Parcubacteria bacterium]|nr:ferric reductase-like transmembrane domain-containing protein [Candidatus Parcubacteria bacterium]
MKRFYIYAIFSVNLIITVVIWWLGSGSLFSFGAPSILIAFGRLFGLLAMFFILTQLILISRVPFIEKEFGFDRLIVLHRRIGYSIVSTIIFHPIFLVIGYAMSIHTSLWGMFLAMINASDDIFKAFIGLLILISVGIISMPLIRKKLRYESWHLIHLLMYVAIFLFVGHQIQGADISAGFALYYWLLITYGVFGIVLIWRFLKPFWVYKKHRFYVERVVPETYDVNSVYITGRRMDEWKYDPGQYMHVVFWQKGMREPHPFTISVPYNGKYIRVTPKAVGDFTSKIPTLKPGTRVLIEGPLGRFTERAAKGDKYLFIAGGIGITPIRSLIESVAKKGKDYILIYGNKSVNDIALKSELDRIGGKQYHVLSNDPHPEFEKGYVDEEKIKRLAPDFLEREIYICGPLLMLNSVKSTFEKLGVPKSQIHYERFAY